MATGPADDIPIRHDVPTANRYDAFISYSHRGERELARELEADLRSFGRRWYQLRGVRCYRDETNLSAEPRLWPAIEAAVSRSRFLILLASPDSAKSAWVPREVRSALRKDAAGAFVVIAQTAGVLPWTDGRHTSELLGHEDLAISSDLLKELDEQGFAPLVVDLRGFRSTQQRQSRRTEYLSAVASIAAQILGKGKDEIWGDYFRAQKQRALFLGVVTCALLGLLLALTLALREAQQRLLLTRSQAMASDARLLAASGEVNAGLRQSVLAYRQSASLEARAALLETLGRAARIKGFYPCEDGRKASGLAFSSAAAPRAAFACMGRIAGATDSVVVVLGADGKALLRRRLPGHVDGLALTGNMVAVNGGTALRVINVDTGNVTELPSGAQRLGRVVYVPKHRALFVVEDGAKVRMWSQDDERWNTSPDVVYDSNSQIESMEYSGGMDAVILRLFDESSIVLTFGGEASPVASARVEHVPSPMAGSHCRSIHPEIRRSMTQTVVQASDARALAYLTEENYVVVERGRGGTNSGEACLLLFGNSHNARIDMSPDGRYVATAGAYFSSDSGHGLILWDLAQIHPLASVIPDSASKWVGKRLGAISQDGSSWAFVLTDRTLWDGRELRLMESAEYPTSVAMAPTGRVLATGYSDGHVELVSRSGENYSTRRVQFGNATVRSLWFVGDELHAMDGSGGVWKAGRESANAPVQLRRSLIDLPACSYAYILGEEIPLEKWAAGKPAVMVVLQSGGKRETTFQVPEDAGSCSSMVYSSQARLGVRIPSEYMDMTVFEPGRTPAFRTLPNPLYDRSGLRQLLQDPVISEDGRVMVAIAKGNGLAVFDVAEGRLMGTIPVPETSAVAMSGDGSRLMTYQEGVGIVSWDMETRRWADIAERMSGIGATE